MAAGDKRTKVDQACKSGEDFATLFYDTLDKKRHLVSNLYLDSALIVWNGNTYTGKDSISKFYEELPVSTSDIKSIDAHHIIDGFVQGKTSILVSASGSIKFTGKTYSPFSESFLLTAEIGSQGNVWKIASDCFRFYEPIP